MAHCRMVRRQNTGRPKNTGYKSNSCALNHAITMDSDKNGNWVLNAAVSADDGKEPTDDARKKHMRFFYGALVYTITVSCLTVVTLFLWVCLYETRYCIVALVSTRMPMIMAITATRTEFSFHHV